jgi:Holliday junction resolvase
MPQGSLYERQFKHFLEDAGCDVIRSAGSLAVDLVAIREIGGVQRTFLFEVKSFKTPRFYPSHDEKTKLQWAEMKRLEKKYWKNGQGAVHVYYALHKKNKGWAIALPSNLDKPELHSDLTHWLKNIKVGGLI